MCAFVLKFFTLYSVSFRCIYGQLKSEYEYLFAQIKRHVTTYYFTCLCQIVIPTNLDIEEAKSRQII